jgi:hypothetical protein
MRSRLALIGACAVLAACGPKPEEKAEAPPPAPAPAPAPPAGPLTYSAKTADAEVSLTLPPQVGAVPALYAKLFSEGRNELDGFVEGARGELEELRAGGEKPGGYARDLKYAVSAETPRLIGLILTAFENTGGAHPNTVLSPTVWDKAAGKALAPAELFAPGADMAAADKALCDAIHAAKQERVQSPDLTGELKDCPKLKDAPLALAASTEPNKAGGVVAVFSPYALGAYVEGAYRVVLPLSAFQGVVNPAYAGEFAGAPAPGQDKGPES